MADTRARTGPMAPAVVEVLVTPGRTTAGLWCGRCLLPSGVQVEVLAISGSGVHPVCAVEYCDGCGTWRRQPWPAT